jgi:hypothetical protein
MTMTTDVTEDRVVLTREGRHLLEARLGHLNERVIPELRAALVDREDARPMYEWGSRMVPCSSACLVSPWWLRTGPVAPTRSSWATR